MYSHKPNCASEKRAPRRKKGVMARKELYDPGLFLLGFHWVDRNLHRGEIVEALSGEFYFCTEIEK